MSGEEPELLDSYVLSPNIWLQACRLKTGKDKLSFPAFIGCTAEIVGQGGREVVAQSLTPGTERGSDGVAQWFELII